MFNRRFQFLFNEAGENGDQGGDGSKTTAPVHFNTDGTLGENWHTGLGDEFSPHADALKPFKDVKSLAKSYLHFRGTGPSYPGDASTPDDITRFHSLAKVPVEGTPTAYGMTIPDNANDVEKGMYDRIAKAAHAAHAPAPVVAAIVGEYQKIAGEIVQAEQQAQQQAQKASEDALIAKWGTNFEANKSTARHVITTFAAHAGIPGDDPGLARLVDDPTFAQIALAFSARTSEDGTRMPTGIGDLRSSQQKADAIMDGSDPIWGKKYTEGTQEEKMAAYNEVVRLQTLASR